ncbi:MAG TPA: hypothetical protein PKD61_16255 [Polyangiaceae bacterium]|nr:hypothetical protein [Polyangiaceae bacterium]
MKNLGGWCWSYCPTDTVVLCDDGDLSTKTTKRVTFDSPGAPRGKVYPAVRLIAIETGGSRGLVAVG